MAVLAAIALAFASSTRASEAQVGLSQRLSDARRLEQGGNVAGALNAYRSLLDRAESAADRAAVLEVLALAETKAGDYKGAARDAAAAATLHRAGGNLRGEAHALNTEGLAAMYSGQYHPAADAFQKAVALSATAGDPDAQVEQLTNLANVNFYIGRYADALTLYTDALGLVDAHADAFWAPRRRYLVQANRAVLDQRLGRHQQALETYRSLAADGADLRPRERAQILANEDVVYRNLGDPVKALDAYDRALALFAADQDVDGELGVLKNRGIALALDLGELAAARRSFSAAVDRARAAGNRREVLQATLYRAEAEFRAGALDAARAGFAGALRDAEALNTPEELWKARYGDGRVALARGETDVARHAFERAIDTIESVRERLRVPALKSDFFSDKRDVYDALIAIELKRGDAARVFGLVERSHARAWRERLGLTDRVSLESVQRRLAAGETLLEYWNSPAGSAVLVVTRDRVEIVPIGVDEQRVQEFVAKLGQGPRAGWRTEAAIVGRMLWPAGPSRDGQLIVVPDGVIAAVPFELLAFGSRVLVEDTAVSYVPTAAMALGSAAEPRRPTWQAELSAFGDPEPARSAFDDVAPTRLIGARSEVAAIAREIGGRARLHVGVDARKTYLRIAEAPMVHIASHAMFDGSALERSRIVFSPEAGRRDADYLFLKEAYELHMNGVELAVLSACDTARGRVVNGEGVQSFSRAFLAAGARSTVTTLWRVPDAETAIFMARFYRHLATGVSRAEALRAAKVEFLRGGARASNPHFWAAFVLTGDGTRPMLFPADPSAPMVSAVLIVVVVLCGLFVLALRKRLFR